MFCCLGVSKVFSFCCIQPKMFFAVYRVFCRGSRSCPFGTLESASDRARKMVHLQSCFWRCGWGCCDPSSIRSQTFYAWRSEQVLSCSKVEELRRGCRLPPLEAGRGSTPHHFLRYVICAYQRSKETQSRASTELFQIEQLRNGSTFKSIIWSSW